MNSLQKYFSYEAHNWFSRIDYKTRRCASERGTLERGGSGRSAQRPRTPRVLRAPRPRSAHSRALVQRGDRGLPRAGSGALRTPVAFQGVRRKAAHFALTLPVSAVCLS